MELMTAGSAVASIVFGTTIFKSLQTFKLWESLLKFRCRGFPKMSTFQGWKYPNFPDADCQTVIVSVYVALLIDPKNFEHCPFRSRIFFVVLLSSKEWKEVIDRTLTYVLKAKRCQDTSNKSSQPFWSVFVLRNLTNTYLLTWNNSVSFITYLMNADGFDSGSHDLRFSS